MKELRQTFFVSFFSLFTSGSTLICCALPAAMVGLGAGASLAGLISNFPQLIWVSHHKVAFFLSAAVMLSIAGILQWRAKSLPCPIDAKLAQQCIKTRKISMLTYLFSLAVFLTGGFFSFGLPWLKGLI